MKKRILSFVVAILCFVPGLFALTACQHICQVGTKWIHDETHHWYACEEEGCTTTENKAQHEWGDGEITTPATYTSNGVKTFTCKVCSATKTEEYTYNKTITSNWIDALCFNGVDNLKYTLFYDGLAVIYEISGSTIKVEENCEITYYTEEDGVFYKYWQGNNVWYKDNIDESYYTQFLPENILGCYTEENFAYYTFNPKTERYENWEEDPYEEDYTSIGFKNGKVSEIYKVEDGLTYSMELFEFGNTNISAPEQFEYPPE